MPRQGGGGQNGPEATREISHRPANVERCEEAGRPAIPGMMNSKEQPTAKDRRDARLRAALRENLKRRKVQARGRAQTDLAVGASPPTQDGPPEPDGQGER